MSTISNKKSDRSCGSVKSLNRSEEFKNVAYLEEHAELSCQTKLKRFLPSFTGPFKSLVGADKINTNLIDRYIDFRRTVKGVEVYAKYKELEANLRGSEIVLGPIAKQVANDFGVKDGFSFSSFLKMCRLSVFRANVCVLYMRGLLSDKRKVSRKIEQALREIPSMSFLEDHVVGLYVRHKEKPLRELFLEILKSDPEECKTLNPNSLLGVALENKRSLKEVIAEQEKYLVGEFCTVNESNSKDFDKVSQVSDWMFWIVACKVCFVATSIGFGSLFMIPFGMGMWNVLSILMGLGVLCVGI